MQVKLARHLCWSGVPASPLGHVPTSATRKTTKSVARRKATWLHVAVASLQGTVPQPQSHLALWIFQITAHAYICMYACVGACRRCVETGEDRDLRGSAKINNSRVCDGGGRGEVKRVLAKAKLPRASAAIERVSEWSGLVIVKFESSICRMSE